MKPGNCGRCRYFAVEPSAGRGQCRRYPPKSADHYGNGHFVWLHPKEGCGEWAERLPTQSYVPMEAE